MSETLDYYQLDTKEIAQNGQSVHKPSDFVQLFLAVWLKSSTFAAVLKQSIK